MVKLPSKSHLGDILKRFEYLSPSSALVDVIFGHRGYLFSLSLSHVVFPEPAVTVSAVSLF